MKQEHLYQYILGIADNSLILGQRLGELCGHGPNLETDIALTNIALDLFGQTRSYYQYAARLAGGGKTEDDVAMLRLEQEYRNVLLVEQPNTHFGHVIARQYLFDVFHFLLMDALQHSKDETLSAVARKGIKEVSYHKRFSGDWLKRLGDGTQESHDKMQEAIDHFWPYTEELFEQTISDIEMVKAGIAIDVIELKEAYYEEVKEQLETATLSVPDNPYFKRGGKDGIHTEHMGYLLADLQFMQRAYPEMKW